MLHFSELVLSEMRRKWIMAKELPHLLLKMTLSDLEEVIVAQKGKIFLPGTRS
jgi:Zn-dependent peptidase ImmA (M78 family)